jgi:D-alanine-D-alanine ligase
MLIGLTYDLKDDYLKLGYSNETVAEFDSLITIDAIDNAITFLGHQTIRIGNIKSLTTYLSCGKRCDLVFNIAEGLHGLCREAQIPALLDAYEIPYVFSDSFTLAMTLHKGIAKSIVREHQVPTADYAIISEENDIENIKLPYPLFIKPIGGGTGMGVNANSIVHNIEQLTFYSLQLLKKFDQPVLVETYLEGREFTVGIIGTHDNSRAIGVMEIIVTSSSDNGIYSYNTKQDYLTTASYQLIEGEIAEECCLVALHAYKALGCRDGGRIDLKMDSLGKVNFLEVNPLAGLNPVDSDLPILCYKKGLTYQDLITGILHSAISRLSIKKLECVS